MTPHGPVSVTPQRPLSESLKSDRTYEQPTILDKTVNPSTFPRMPTDRTVLAKRFAFDVQRSFIDSTSSTARKFASLKTDLGQSAVFGFIRHVQLLMTCVSVLSACPYFQQQQAFGLPGFTKFDRGSEKRRIPCLAIYFDTLPKIPVSAIRLMSRITEVKERRDKKEGDPSGNGSPVFQAERAGFEPAVRVNPNTGLAIRPIRPLWHLSGVFLVHERRLSLPNWECQVQALVWLKCLRVPLTGSSKFPVLVLGCDGRPLGVASSLDAGVPRAIAVCFYLVNQ